MVYRVAFFLLRLGILFCMASNAYADDRLGDETKIKKAPRFEVYSGADYAGKGASLYSNAVWSIFGSVTEPGWRLRFDGLVNIYGVDSAPVFSSGFVPSDMTSASDLMLGYQLNRGALWLKLYAGAAYTANTKAIRDAGALHLSQQWSGKVAVESWWRTSDRVWASADLTWFQAENDLSLYTRLAYEVLRFDPKWIFSVGGEGSVMHGHSVIYSQGRGADRFDNYFRGGALLNIRYGFHDLSLSGGVAQSASEAAQPYATLSYGRKF